MLRVLLISRCSLRKKSKGEIKNGQHHVSGKIYRQEDFTPPLAQEEEVQSYDEKIEDLEKGTDEVPSHPEDTVTVHMREETSE